MFVAHPFLGKIFFCILLKHVLVLSQELKTRFFSDKLYQINFFWDSIQTGSGFPARPLKNRSIVPGHRDAQF